MSSRTFRLSEGGQIILQGELSGIVLDEKLVFEFKDFFNRPGLQDPVFTFEIDGESYTVRPRLVGNGWQAKQKRKEWALGINLFRVKNRSGRYALTVWIEPLKVVV